MPPHEPLAVRFQRKVDKRAPDECWLWIGALRSDGYGAIGADCSDRILAAHRVAYELANGAIPKLGGGYHGTVVMHTCDNRKCVNPAHLRASTQTENLRDMDLKSRRVNAQPRGERQGSHKLTDAAVREIRSSSDSVAVLATKFGVSEQNIVFVLQRKTWRHV